MRFLTAFMWVMATLFPLASLAGQLNYSYVNIGWARSSQAGLSVNGPGVAASSSITDYFALHGSFSYLSTNGYNISTLILGGTGHIQVLKNTDVVLTAGLIHPNFNTSTQSGVVSQGKSSGLVGVGIRTAPFRWLEADVGFTHYRTDLWSPGMYTSVNTSYGTILYAFNDGLVIYLTGAHTTQATGGGNTVSAGIRMNFR